MKNKPHISFEGNYEKNSYKTPKPTPVSPLPIKRDRSYGNYLLGKIEKIKELFNVHQIENTDLVIDNSIYIEFVSEWGQNLILINLIKMGLKKTKSFSNF